MNRFTFEDLYLYNPTYEVHSHIFYDINEIKTSIKDGDTINGYLISKGKYEKVLKSIQSNNALLNHHIPDIIYGGKADSKFKKGDYVVLIKSATGDNCWEDSIPEGYIYRLSHDSWNKDFSIEKDTTNSATNGWTGITSSDTTILLRQATPVEIQAYKDNNNRPISIFRPHIIKANLEAKEEEIINLKSDIDETKKKGVIKELRQTSGRIVRFESGKRPTTVESGLVGNKIYFKY